MDHLDPGQGEHVNSTTHAVILTDRPCTGCGYNLRGLNEGGLCPECGARILSQVRRFDRISDNLTDAPKTYLRLVAAGVWLLVSGILAVPLIHLAGWFAPTLAQSPAAAPIASAASSLLWAAGAVLVTTPRPANAGLARDVLLDSDKLRWTVRGFQVAVVIAAAANLAQLATTHIAISIVGAAAALLSFGGFLTLSVYLSSLADWAGEEGIGSRLRSATWAVVVCGGFAVVLILLAAFGLSPFGVVGMIAALVLGGIAGFGMLVVLFSIVQLGSTTLWALRNAKASTELQRRRAERLANEADERARRAEQAHAAMANGPAAASSVDVEDTDEPLPLSEPGPEPPPSQRQPSGVSRIKHTPPGIASGRRWPPRDRD